MTYNEFIENIIKTRGRHGCIGYYEKHHIIPKCLGGSNDESNLVDLYADEHYNAHKLLFYENKTNKKLFMAWHMMAFPKGDTNRDFQITAEDYKKIREQFSYFNKVNNPMKNDATRKKMATTKRGIKPSPETKRKMSMSYRYDIHNKKVLCVELNKVFNSIKEAKIYCGCNSLHIGEVCEGKREKTGGYHWKYVK